MPARFDLDGDALDLDPAAAPPAAPDDAADPALDLPGLGAGDPGAAAAPETEAESDDGDPAYVRWVQRALNQIAGLRLGTDGVAGTQTRSAIRAFQARRGLPVDGIANPATRDALVQAGAPPPAGSPVPSRDPHLRAAIARWNLPTGLPDAPTFHELVERWRPRHIPLALLVAFSSLEASGWTDATHGTPGNGYTSPDFFELGMFQTPAGRHGTCTSGRYADCEFAPPGSDPRGGSPWFQIARQLGLDPARWTDRTLQVRIGLANLERDAAKVRGRFPELFPDKASDWAIRAAVLLPFGPGIGYTIGLLAKHRAALAKLPESERWAMLQRSGARTKNSDDKMALARQLAEAMGVASTMPPVAGELSPLFR
jgi:peptidoglycan hydrolase-like protein with peptidoglycan-binding domain